MYMYVCRQSIINYWQHLPNLSSPKLPQPIFFPTLKFGPTISTPLVDTLDVRELFDALPRFGRPRPAPP